MTSLEDRIRDAYRAVTDTVREDDLPELNVPDRGRARSRGRGLGRFSTFAPLAAAAAVVVAIAASVAVPKLASSPAPPAVSFTSRATPPFVIILNKPDSHGNMGPLEVVSAATGQITGRVPEPRKGSTWFDVALTGSGTRFVVAATPARGGLCNPTYLYLLTLSASGAPASLRPWTDPVVPLEIGQLAASADGGTLAFEAYPCRGAYQEVGVIRGTTMKTWREPFAEFADFLSLSADGTMLGYAAAGFRGGGQARVLDTRSAPGSATAASKVLFTFPAGARAPSALLGADGTTMYVFWLAGPDGNHLTRTLAGFRIGPGGARGTLFRRTMPTGEFLTRAGGRLLIWGGTSLYLVDPVTGQAARVRAKAWTTAWGIYW